MQTIVVVLIGGTLLLIGVCLLMVGLSRPRANKSKLPVVREEFDEENGSETMSEERVSLELNGQYLGEQLLKIQESPNVLDAYCVRKKASFLMGQETKLIKKRKRQYKQIQGLVENKTKVMEELRKQEDLVGEIQLGRKIRPQQQQAAAYRAEAEVHRAKLEVDQTLTQTPLIEAEQIKGETQRITAGLDQNIAQDPSIVELMRKNRETEIRQSIAKKEALIRGFDRKARSAPGVGEEQVPKSQSELVRERILAKCQIQADDQSELMRWRTSELNKLDLEKAEDLKEIEAMDISEEMKEDKRYEIEAMYANRRDKILSANPFKH